MPTLRLWGANSFAPGVNDQAGNNGAIYRAVFISLKMMRKIQRITHRVGEFRQLSGGNHIRRHQIN